MISVEVQEILPKRQGLMTYLDTDFRSRVYPELLRETPYRVTLRGFGRIVSSIQFR